MTTINNNLTIEQMREIVGGAPDWATHFNQTDNKYEKQIKVISLGFTAVNYSLACLKSNKDEVICLDDLRTAIAKHDNTDIGTEIDSFLDAFKSPELTDERKEELTQDWKGMSGGVAFNLIERHADNWKEIDYMMNQWLEANKEAERHG